jgi:peptidylprolyl isomerase
MLGLYLTQNVATTLGAETFVRPRPQVTPTASTIRKDDSMTDDNSEQLPGAKSGDTVKLHYTGTLDDGTQFDSSAGEGTIIPTLETSVIGMIVGDTQTVRIDTEDAYGLHHEEAIQTVDRSMIPEELEVALGGQLQATAPDGQQLLPIVTAIEDDQVTLDANHPLAGQDLNFDIELVAIA